MNAALDRLYAQLLQVGLVVLRQAAEDGDNKYVLAELELLHNVPSLIGEENVERHRFFWEQEIPQYLERLTSRGDKLARSRMRTYYEPLWDEMTPLMRNLLGATAGEDFAGGPAAGLPSGESALHGR